MTDWQAAGIGFGVVLVLGLLSLAVAWIKNKHQEHQDVRRIRDAFPGRRTL